MEILSSLFYFIIIFGVLVLVHEFGHFITAKFFKMRAEVFAIGMGKRLFGWNKKSRFSFGSLPRDLDLENHTDYRVSMFPIGGYVKIAGMIDESMDTNFLSHDPQPWEFRAKPIWQRSIVMCAGVAMNVLLAICIFWGIIYYNGKIVRPITEIGYVVPNSAAAHAGLQVGDKIVAINNHVMKQWDDVESLIYTESAAHDMVFQVQRNDSVKLLTVQHATLPDLTQERFGILPAGLVPVVQAVEKGKPAEAIGLQPNDTILAVNGTRINSGSLPEVVKANAEKEILLTWKRGTQTMETKVTPTKEGRIGISLSVAYYGPVLHENYTIIEALPAGIHEVVFASQLFLTNIYQIIVGKASFSNSVGGPVKIAQMANQSAESGITSFLGFLALLSITLALINILPFPALDGGHLAFLVFEAIFKREVPDKIRIIVQQIGFFILLAFMVFVLYNDVVHF
ncbi:MAG TPA: RIP metalloprotease RseP [Bacteroidota bacterium]|nr:RIP metalloprotease RseP [Bacteroidota bacterium]